MAPLLQLVVQCLLGSSRLSNPCSQDEAQWPISYHADGKALDLVLTSAISLSTVSWGPNRADVFGIGPNKDVLHKFWDGYGWRPSVDTFESLGGHTDSPPTAVAWGPNRLDIFIVGKDQDLLHKYWDGSSWRPSTKDWESLGGRLNPPSVFAATSWGVDRLDIFAVSPDSNGKNALWHKSWDGSGWSPEGQLQNLGGDFVGEPAVTSWGPDRLDVFAVDRENHLLHRHLDVNTWSSWEILGDDFVGTPTAVSWEKNRVDVFALRASGELFHRFWNAADSAWTNWENFGNEFKSAVGVTSWSKNRFDIFGLGPSSAYYYKYWDGYQWNPAEKVWYYKGGNFTSAPSVVSWGENRLDIFGVGSDRQLTHQTWTGTGWYPDQNSWEKLGGPLRSF